MENLLLTQEQVEQAFQSAVAIENPVEKQKELMKLRCRIRQTTYYNIGDYESIVNEELSLMQETGQLENIEVYRATDPKPKVRMKVASSFCMAIFKKAGISLANFDATRIAEAISLMTGFSTDSIRKYIREQTGFLNTDIEARKAQTVLDMLGVQERLLA